MPVRIAVLASGGGSNLQALIDRFHTDAEAPARIELLVASRPAVGALERAERTGIPTAVLTPDEQGDLAALLAQHRIDLVVLAGYLRLVPDSVVDAFRGRIMNVHPALLPAFGGPGMYGMRVHQAVIESGARVSGATVHLVDERYDEGPILAQWPVPVLPDDTAERLAARVLRVEHLLLPAAVDAFARGGSALPLTEPLAFDFADQDAPPAASVARLTSATCKPER